MDAGTITIIVVAIFALLVLVAVLLGRDVKGEVGSRMAGMKFGASKPRSDTQPGAVIRDSTSDEGGAMSRDETGRGALVERTEVKGDLTAHASSPGGDSPPKV